MRAASDWSLPLPAWPPSLERWRRRSASVGRSHPGQPASTPRLASAVPTPVFSCVPRPRPASSGLEQLETMRRGRAFWNVGPTRASVRRSRSGALERALAPEEGGEGPTKAADTIRPTARTDILQSHGPSGAAPHGSAREDQREPHPVGGLSTAPASSNDTRSAGGRSDGQPNRLPVVVFRGAAGARRRAGGASPQAPAPPAATSGNEVSTLAACPGSCSSSPVCSRSASPPA